MFHETIKPLLEDLQKKIPADHLGWRLWLIVELFVAINFPTSCFSDLVWRPDGPLCHFCLRYILYISSKKRRRRRRSWRVFAEPFNDWSCTVRYTGWRPDTRLAQLILLRTLCDIDKLARPIFDAKTCVLAGQSTERTLCNVVLFVFSGHFSTSWLRLHWTQKWAKDSTLFYVYSKSKWN